MDTGGDCEEQDEKEAGVLLDSEGPHLGEGADVVLEVE